MAAWYLKAYSLAMLNRTNEACAAVDQALLLDPFDRDSNNLKADILESLGRDEEAARFRDVAAGGGSISQPDVPIMPPPTTKSPLNPLVSVSTLLVVACLIGIRAGGR
ncbi:MAG: Tetratricopeptide repeat protein [Methanoregulaceae archaeon PtaU1.Bin066]|jgi:alkyl sulfatase BDS1-like metallo-beta-lactamase superfamily hydrolase|nr:MAG: Tetratricopeptide repeat protein [Methanoregulaceae archaeon PtaU1.Bin066]